MAKKEKKIRRKKNWFQDTLEAILFAFVVAMVIRSYTFQNFKIPSSSMESTLLINDYLAASRFKYFFTDPKRGDIVTFRNPADPVHPKPEENYTKILPPVYWNKSRKLPIYYAKKNIVKRVIGMPGDTIKVVNKKVYINNEEYRNGKEQYIDHRQFSKDAPRGIIPRTLGNITWKDGKFHGSRDNFGPVTVPEGCYFVMGDNRDNSYDSRFWGFLKRNEITGTPSFIFWSHEGNNFIKGIRWERIFSIIR